MIKDKIRIGIFGLGRGGGLVEAILMNDGKIVAICDKDKAKCDQYAQRLGDETAVSQDFDTFLKTPMDAVLLANYFPEHASYAIRCLEKGIHVLSECLSNATMAEGVALVRAAEQSSAIYMLAENYPYMQFNQEIKRICDSGTLGKVLFAEGEYNHPVAPNDHNFIKGARSFPLHWRNYLPRTYYITHSLAPLMYSTGAVPKKVTAFPVYEPFSEDYATCSPVGDRAAIITCLNNDNSVFRVTGCAAFGAHENSYRVCGTKGQVENVRGTDGKIMLRYNAWDIPEGKEENNLYMPEWHDESADLIEKTGHGGGDYFVFKRFFEAIRTNSKPDFDVYFATTTASVAILAHRSLLAGGTPIEIPDFHLEAHRKQYEKDFLSPFPGLDTLPASLPCCSHPDYQPSSSQVEKYLQIIGASSDSNPAQ